MKLATLILMLATGSVAPAQDSRLDLAKTVRHEHDLQALVESSFGGGRHYQVGESRFHVVDLQTHSGLLVSEIFIFERIGDELKFRMFLPGKISHARKAEYLDGALIVSELAQGEEEWKVVLKWID